MMLGWIGWWGWSLEGGRLALTRYFDSVCSCGDADGLVVVEVLEVLDAEVWVGGVFEVGHCLGFGFVR
jgi:hypothetical protein